MMKYQMICFLFFFSFLDLDPYGFQIEEVNVTDLA